MKVKLSTDGSVVDVTEEEATDLIRMGFATAEPTSKRKKENN